MNEQIDFWKNKYGTEYRKKNAEFDNAKGMEAWKKMLNKAKGITTILECGSNIGRNIQFLNQLLPDIKTSLIELNEESFKYAIQNNRVDQFFNGAILEAPFKPISFDLVFTCGVLIHIHPDELLKNMEKMYSLSKKYILIGEYFNRKPIMIEYQGESNKLFKRDFGKYFIENFSCSVVDYGFLWGYEYDNAGFDDITWWLFEKRN